MNNYDIKNSKNNNITINNNINNNILNNKEWNNLVKFHGHSCPGLAIGYKVAEYVKKYYKPSEDEELIAIVENDSCGVDAIQYMLSCTFGKGNLIFKDYGKHVYTIYHRNGNGEAIRIYVKNVLEDFRKIREKYTKNNLSEKEQEEYNKIKNEIASKILNMDYKELLVVKKVPIKEPKRAKLYNSIPCNVCGEYFMEIKGRIYDGKIVCLECFEKLLNEDDK